MISDEIIKVLDNLCIKFGIAIDWTNQNIMPYLQDLMTRFIKYKTATDILWLIIGAILFALAIVGLKKLTKWRKSDEFDNSYYSEDRDKHIWGMLGTICTLLLGISLILPFANGIIQNICMPELTIIKYIQWNML